MTEVIQLNRDRPVRECLTGLRQFRAAEQRYRDFRNSMIPNVPVDAVQLGELAHEAATLRRRYLQNPIS